MNKWIAVLGLLAFACNASAQGKGKGKGKGKSSTASSVSGAAFFDDANRRVISDWVQVQPHGGLPPGLRKGLPPGLQKQLQRNGHLPPGLEKKITPFPAELQRQLPPPPPSCDYVFVDGSALLVNRATNIIIDIMAVF